MKDEHFEVPSGAEIIVQEKLGIGNEKQSQISVESADFFKQFGLIQNPMEKKLSISKRIAVNHLDSGI